MKKIILERLTLRNFKGFKEFVLATNGGNVDAYGDNGTGKTTAFDGFIWLLFGKDSLNRSEFEIKELDAAGKVKQHKLDHEVEGDILINGRRRTFRRVYSEKWTKKRGSAMDSFEGHTTSYFVDGVPVKLSEYKAEVDSIIKEDLFRLLTSPTFFNEVLKADERRKVLMEVCGGITDAEIIHTNRELERLLSILEDRTVEKHAEKVKARQKDINAEIKYIPTKINEAMYSKPDIADLDEELLQEDIDSIRSRVQAKEEELLRIRNGGETAVKEKRIREIESELLSIQNKLQSEVLDKVAHQRNEVGQLQRDFDSLRRQIEDKRHQIQHNERTIEFRNQDTERLKAKWSEVNGQVFEHHHDENCPTCGQTLPGEQKQAAHVKAEADFNRGKAHRLEQISSEGKRAKDEVRHLELANTRLLDEINKLSDGSAILQVDLKSSESELDNLRSGIQDPRSNPEYQNLNEEKEQVEKEINSLRDSAKESYEIIKKEIDTLRSELMKLEEEKAKFAHVRKIEQRIKEHERQERELAAEYERLQEELFLTEEFKRTKVALMDSKIQTKFKYARFRLFEDQINGGLKDVCETMFEGVPYDKGLNRAAQYNVGIDIINVLSDYYGFSAPIFIDNAEAVTQLIDTDAQVIRLVVSEADKKLRVVPHNTMQEAI
ncbi:AAA family ATPase [Paenibacillus dokdonensis]|uniref:AAA family ATPase n=1 Tax=Paenibacillus dokdonensis TaxID=2567944 RepID=UPI0010A7B560|nr:AAA family ATPase [Paenibacillus dokdonensis]